MHHHQEATFAVIGKTALHPHTMKPIDFLFIHASVAEIQQRSNCRGEAAPRMHWLLWEQPGSEEVMLST